MGHCGPQCGLPVLRFWQVLSTAAPVLTLCGLLPSYLKSLVHMDSIDTTLCMGPIAMTIPIQGKVGLLNSGHVELCFEIGVCNIFKHHVLQTCGNYFVNYFSTYLPCPNRIYCHLTVRLSSLVMSLSSGMEIGLDASTQRWRNI